MNREPIYTALFAKLAAVPGIVTASRKLKHWSDVPAIEQPALFMAQGAETAIRAAGLLTKWVLDVKVYVYVNTSGALAPSSALNPILDAIEAIMNPALVGSRQSLGGLVHDARIEGAVETDEGSLGDQAVAIIPVRIITA
jgi:hypothetical protein